MTTRSDLISFVIRISLINLVFVALIGILMRGYFLYFYVDFIYRNWLHTHSHLAFLGWAYPMLFMLIIDIFDTNGNQLGIWKRLFVFMQISVVGMLLSFPISGYSWYSIVLSTLHMIISFVFIAKIMKLLRKSDKGPAGIVLKWAFYSLILSSIGPLALGPISVLGYKSTPWYEAAIYYYLHFQYNGWFILAICFLLLQGFNQTNSNARITPNQLHLLAGSFVILTYFLSIVELFDHSSMHYLGGLGSVLQFLFFAIILKMLIPAWKNLKAGTIPRLLILTSVSIVLLKVVLQMVTAIPSITSVIYDIRDLVIAYLHLVLIGAVTLFLLGVALHKKWIREDVLTRFASISFLSGFLVTESILVMRGLSFLPVDSMNTTNKILFYSSFLFLIGAILYLLSAMRSKPLVPSLSSR